MYETDINLEQRNINLEAYGGICNWKKKQASVRAFYKLDLCEINFDKTNHDTRM